jgi:hypothetical protein
MAAMSQFSSLEGLLVLGERAEVDIRPTLLRVLTDLYMQKPVHSHAEAEHYTELALRLIDSVDEPTRQLIRARLDSYPSAPTAVTARLAALAIPPRPAPHASPARVLLRPATAAEPVRPLPARPMRVAAPTAAELTEQFFEAAPEERRLILLNLHLACAPRPPRGRLPDASGIVSRIETAVLQRNFDETIWQLERALELGRATARRIVQDDSGEPFLVAAKVIGIPTHVLHRILLFLNPVIGRSVQRVYELAALYDEVDPLTAERLLKIWRDGEMMASRAPSAAPGPIASEIPAERRELATLRPQPLRPMAPGLVQHEARSAK